MIHEPPHPTHHDIEARAYALWEHSGHPDGQQEEHWLRAERELTHDAEQAAALRGDSHHAPDHPVPPAAHAAGFDSLSAQLECLKSRCTRSCGYRGIHHRHLY